MKLPVPVMEPCPVLSSAMKQAGPSTVKVPIGVATLHGLPTRVTSKILLEPPASVAVMTQLPGMFVELGPDCLLLDPQLDNNVPTNSKANTANGAKSFFIRLLLRLLVNLPRNKRRGPRLLLITATTPITLVQQSNPRKWHTRVGGRHVQAIL